MNTEAALRKAAHTAINEIPQIEAVLLFGSRARGDHHRWSDWDLAAVTGQEQPCSEKTREALARSDRTHLLIIPRARLEERCNTAGAVEAAIVHDARVIAGSWKRPEHRLEGLEMNRVTSESIQNLMTMGTGHIETGMREAARARRKGFAASRRTAFESVRGAEGVAKAVIVSFALSPRERA